MDVFFKISVIVTQLTIIVIWCMQWVVLARYFSSYDLLYLIYSINWFWVRCMEYSPRCWCRSWFPRRGRRLFRWRWAAPGPGTAKLAAPSYLAWSPPSAHSVLASAATVKQERIMSLVHCNMNIRTVKISLHKTLIAELYESIVCKLNSNYTF